MGHIKALIEAVKQGKGDAINLAVELLGTLKIASLSVEQIDKLCEICGNMKRIDD